MRTTLLRLFPFVLFGSCVMITSCAFPQGASSTATPPGKITFMSTRDGKFDIYSMNAKGENLANLTNQPELDYCASYAPSGTSLYFYSKRDGNNEIYSMEANGDHPLNVTRHPASDRLPQISPDGTKIVFLSDRDTKEGELYLMNPDGSHVRRLTINEVFEDAACWSPDGKLIVYSRDAHDPKDTLHPGQDDFELFRIHPDGTEETKLTDMPGFCAGPAYSPDGKKIAFYARGKDGHLDIFTIKPDGKGLKNITRDTTENYSPAWSPDGAWIAYTGGDISNYDIWIIHLKTLEKRRLTSHPKRDETPTWTK